MTTQTRTRHRKKQKIEPATLAEAEMISRLDRIALLLANETEELQTVGMEDFCSRCTEFLRTRGMDGRSASQTVGRLGERLISRICHFERTMGRA